MNAIAAAIRSAPPAAWRSAPPTPEAPAPTPMQPKAAPKPIDEQKTMTSKSFAGNAEAANARTLDQLALVRLIGERLRQARELNNMSQSEAAKRLGYANSAKLSKVELAIDTASLPFMIIANAARLYEVTADFLFGLTDDWDTGTARGVSDWVFRELDAARQRDFVILAGLHARVDAVTDIVPALHRDARDVLDAIRRVEELNPEAFPDLRAGARLAAAAERLTATSGQAVAVLRRFRLEIDRATQINEKEYSSCVS